MPIGSMLNQKPVRPFKLCKGEWTPSLLNIDQTIVTIKIGPSAKEYTIHRELLCRASPYFDRAFKRDFVEAQDRVISLADVSTETFDVFQEWVYSGTLTFPYDVTQLGKAKPGAELCSECKKELPSGNEEMNPLGEWAEDLLELYVFADKYDTLLLRREIMITYQLMGEVHNTYPGWFMVSKAFAELPHNSQFCSYLVDAYRRWWDPRKGVCKCRPSEEHEAFRASENLPPAFMYQLMTRYGQNCRIASVLLMLNWCKFHEHANEDDIEACQTRRKADGRRAGCC